MTSQFGNDAEAHYFYGLLDQAKAAKGDDLPQLIEAAQAAAGVLDGPTGEFAADQLRINFGVLPR